MYLSLLDIEVFLQGCFAYDCCDGEDSLSSYAA